MLRNPPQPGSYPASMYPRDPLYGSYRISFRIHFHHQDDGSFIVFQALKDRSSLFVECFFAMVASVALDHPPSFTSPSPFTDAR